MTFTKILLIFALGFGALVYYQSAVTERQQIANRHAAEAAEDARLWQQAQEERRRDEAREDAEKLQRQRDDEAFERDFARDFQRCFGQVVYYSSLDNNQKLKALAALYPNSLYPERDQRAVCDLRR